jgi:hypothetical protein
MPNSTRWAIKQQMDGALNGLQRSQDTLTLIGSQFEAQHPVIFQRFCAFVSAIETIKKPIKQQRDEI